MGTITYNTQPLTHAGHVGLFTEDPALPHAPVVAFADTDDAGNFTLGPVVPGTYWFAASYAPGIFDGGPANLPDGGLGVGAIAGLTLDDPIQVSGTVTQDLNLTEMVAAMYTITVNEADAPAGTIPTTGAVPLPDGGALFPLIIEAAVAGTDPLSGQPVSDATTVTFGDDAGPSYTMAFQSQAATPADDAYAYVVPFDEPAGWKAADQATYYFTVAGSATLGATESRQIEVNPFMDVPVITSPADQSHGSLATGVVVAWADPAGATGAEVKASDLSTDGGVICDEPYPQQTPVTLGLTSQPSACAFQLGHAYRIDVLSSRVNAQAQGVSFEAAYARVRVSF